MKPKEVAVRELSMNIAELFWKETNKNVPTSST